MRLIIKALKRDKIKNPGIRGGKYWVDKQGNVRYDKQNIQRLTKISAAGAAYFMDNIRYYVGMAKNIGAKMTIKPDYYDGQPVGVFADMLAAGRMACIKTYNDQLKRKLNKNELKIVMNKRVSSAMWGIGLKLRSLVNLSYHDSRHKRVIDGFKDKYFNKYGHNPDAETIAQNIELKDSKNNKYGLESKLKIIDSVQSDVQVDKNVDNLPSDNDIQMNIEIPTIDKLMEPIKKLWDSGKIKTVDYQIIQMYLGIGKYKTPQTLDEISKKLGKDRRYASNRFSLIKPILQPYFEKYRGLLEKSMIEDRILDFIREVLK